MITRGLGTDSESLFITRGLGSTAEIPAPEWTRGYNIEQNYRSKDKRMW